MSHKRYIKRSRLGAGLEWSLITYAWAMLAVPYLLLTQHGMPHFLAGYNYHLVGLISVGITYAMGWLFYRFDRRPTRDLPHEPVGTGRRKDYTWMVTVPLVISILCYLLFIAKQSAITALVIDYVKKIVA